MPTHTFILNGKPRHRRRRTTTSACSGCSATCSGVTGPKYGCGINVCKACTSHLNGKAFNPCSVPVGDVRARPTR